MKEQGRCHARTDWRIAQKDRVFAVRSGDRLSAVRADGWENDLSEADFRLPLPAARCTRASAISGSRSIVELEEPDDDQMTSWWPLTIWLADCRVSATAACECWNTCASLVSMRKV